MLRLLGIAVIVIAIGLAVIFHGEIKQFSDTFVTAKQAQGDLKSGDLASAIHRYEEKVKQNPDNIDLAMGLADLYLQKSENQKAIDTYREIMNNHPDHMASLLAFGRLQQETPEKRNNVLSLYRKALKRKPGNGHLLSAVGNVYLKAAENEQETRKDVKNWLYDWAIYYYRHAISKDAKLADTRFNLGIAYQQTGRDEKAATTYCNALVLNPNTFEARYNLGVTLIKMNALQEGYQQLDRATRLLMDSDRVQEAQMLAERVQSVKNMVYNDSSASGLNSGLSAESMSRFMSQDCLLGKPSQEAPSAEKSTEE